MAASPAVGVEGAGPATFSGPAVGVEGAGPAWQRGPSVAAATKGLATARSSGQSSASVVGVRVSISVGAEESSVSGGVSMDRAPGPVAAIGDGLTMARLGLVTAWQ